MYTVTYKRSGSLFSTKLKRVKGDGIVETNLSRYFILEDESRIEIPINNYIFKFSSGRFVDIKKNIEQEIGQPIVTR